MSFNDNSSAADGTFAANGGRGQSGGAAIYFFGTSSAARATLTAASGIGQGGHIYFVNDARGGKGRVELFGNGTLDISATNQIGVSLGSIEGNGLVELGAKNLTVGTNNLSTTFSGVIEDGGTGGSLTKTGNGKLTLSNANTYTGGTTVNKGTLLVTNRTDSATGTGAVQVNAGKLGGTGTIGGNVTVGTGSGPGAFLTPGVAAARPATLSIQSTLTFQADGTDHFGYKSSNATADKVVAKGVTISSGAQLFFGPIDTGALTLGTVFTAIDNTAATPISGTFANLADGSTVTISNNTFQANYEGGDGNDLTLTVVP